MRLALAKGTCGKCKQDDVWLYSEQDKLVCEDCLRPGGKGMKTLDSKVVMFDSADAAQYKTNLSGWVSRHGLFFGNDERTARYDGCTHTRCEDCGEPVDRGRLICSKCNEARDIKRYAAMPKEEWDGKGMLYSDATDKYFSDWDEVESFLEDNEGTIESLRLIICEPQYLSLLDSSDYGCDVLAEDGELPDAVIKAIEDFDRVIKATGPVSWTPGKKAAISPCGSAHVS